MGLNDRLKGYLDQEQGAYEIMPHREVFSSREVAAESHVTDRQLAKVLAVREEDDGHLMVVLPAACRLDLNALRHATGRHRLSFVPEDDMGRLFPDCEIGAMPPFGQLYEMPVYLDACFSRAQTIVFRAGNHHEVVRMPYVEYGRLVKPVVGEFCTHVRGKDLAA